MRRLLSTLSAPPGGSWSTTPPPEVEQQEVTPVRVAVAGGTGTVGRHVVAVLRTAGHEPVVLARSRGIDVATGTGLAAVLAGADAVIDVSNVPTTRRRAAVRYFPAASSNLLRAGEQAGVQHHVALSIVGIDGARFGYYQGKRRQEDVVLTGPVPATVLRATQFLEFVGQVLAQSRGPLAPVPRMLTQPVAAREVAEALVNCAVGPPQGRAPDLAGPQVHEVVDLARRLLRARGERRLIVPLTLPGAAARQMRHGALLAGPGARLGTQTFDQWLQAHPTSG